MSFLILIFKISLLAHNSMTEKHTVIINNISFIEERQNIMVNSPNAKKIL